MKISRCAILFGLSFLLVFSSCVTGRDDESFSVTPYVNYYGVRVRYEGRDFLIGQETKKAENEMREPDYALIPESGRIFLYLQGPTIETGNPKNFTYIVRDSTETEIFRGSGRDTIPDYEVSQYATVWRSIDMISLNESVVFPLSLRVVTPGAYGKDFVDVTIQKKEAVNNG
jgi:hypothetical protein